jgi:endonuclease YncB( thermonuclease family)
MPGRAYEGLALAYPKHTKKYTPEKEPARSAKRGLCAGEFVTPWGSRRGGILVVLSGIDTNV